ncbi:MAG: RNA polymerase sigma factor [Gemmatimonadaceae bacterium]|nr:RNA polymerase sigma factor [Gemmatimonadaceae bacterium]
MFDHDEHRAAASSSEPDDVAALARDTDLIARARRGDALAFDALITPVLPRALQLARRLLRHEQDAEDLVQDACLRALERLEQHDGSRAFAPWFMRVLTNLGLNRQQSRRVRNAEPLSDVTPSIDSLPDAIAERAEVQERFARAVAALSDRQRQVIMLHEVEGWTTTDIGVELQLSQPTIRWHLHDARRTLRAALGNLRDDALRPNQETG